MKTSCIHFPCGISGTSACCNAQIQSSDICKDCGEHCEDACDECEEFVDANDCDYEKDE